MPCWLLCHMSDACYGCRYDCDAEISRMNNHGDAEVSSYTHTHSDAAISQLTQSGAVVARVWLSTVKGLTSTTNRRSMGIPTATGVAANLSGARDFTDNAKDPLIVSMSIIYYEQRIKHEIEAHARAAHAQCWPHDYMQTYLLLANPMHRTTHGQSIRVSYTNSNSSGTRSKLTTARPRSQQQTEAALPEVRVTPRHSCETNLSMQHTYVGITTRCAATVCSLGIGPI